MHRPRPLFNLSPAPPTLEALRDSLIADIKMGGYGGRPHGGNFARLAAAEPQMAMEVLDHLLGQMPQGEWPADAAGLAGLLFWETPEAERDFILQNTAWANGSNLTAPDGRPVESAADLSQFLADVDQLGPTYSAPDLN
jgi:hypothetical protein